MTCDGGALGFPLRQATGMAHGMLWWALGCPEACSRHEHTGHAMVQGMRWWGLWGLQASAGHAPQHLGLLHNLVLVHGRVAVARKLFHSCLGGGLP